MFFKHLLNIFKKVVVFIVILDSCFHVDIAFGSSASWRASSGRQCASLVASSEPSSCIMQLRMDRNMTWGIMRLVRKRRNGDWWSGGFIWCAILDGHIKLLWSRDWIQACCGKQAFQWLRRHGCELQIIVDWVGMMVFQRWVCWLNLPETRN